MAKQDVETLTELIEVTLRRVRPDVPFRTEVREGYDRDGVDGVRVFLVRGQSAPLPDAELDAIAREVEDVVLERDERFASVFFPEPV